MPAAAVPAKPEVPRAALVFHLDPQVLAFKYLGAQDEFRVRLFGIAVHDGVGG
jgi:hypothetical protein